MPSITDLRMQLNLEVNEGAFINQLRNIKAELGSNFDSHVKSYQSMLSERLKIEQRFFTAEENRASSLAKLIQLQQDLNLSSRAYYGLLREIDAQYEKEAGITARNAQAKLDALARETSAVKELSTIEEIRRQQKRKEITDAFTANSSANNSVIAEIRRQQERATLTRVFTDKHRAETAPTLTPSENIQEQIRRQERVALATRIYNNKAIEDSKRLQAQRELEAEAERKANQARFESMFKVANVDSHVTANEAALNAERQRAVGVLMSLQRPEQAFIRMREELLDLYKRSVISQAEYNEALSDVSYRERTMMGGAGRMGYVIGNLATGFEDFVTVMSITGFRMDSISAGFRAASNNVGQAIRGLNTAYSGLYAMIFTIGTIALGSLIPRIYYWITSEEEAKKAVEALNNEIAKRTRLFEMNSEAIDRQIKLQRELNEMNEVEGLKNAREFNGVMVGDGNPAELKNFKTVEDVDKAIKKLQEEKEDATLKLKQAEDAFKAQAQGLLNSAFSNDTIEDFNIAVNYLGRTRGSETEAALRKQFQDIKTRFETNIKVLDPKEAIKQLESDTRKLQQALTAYGLPEAQMSNKLSVSNFKSLMGEFLDDPKAIDDVQALLADEEQLNKLAEERNKSAEDYRKELQAILDTTTKIKELEGLRDTVASQAQVKAEKEANEEYLRLKKEYDAEMQRRHEETSRLAEEGQQLKETVRGNSLRDSAKEIFDMSMRRREIIESGVLGAAELEGLANQELMAKQKDIEKELSNQLPTGQNSTATLSQAVTDVNKQIVATLLKPKDDKQAEMIKVLNAIKDHLAGRKILMEVIN